MVLNGTYVYPDNMEPYTRLILEQARNVFSQMSDDEVTDVVTTQDFQEFWQHAKEDIQSSESGVHFGHYKAASFDRHLSTLQAAKLTLAAQSGVPLERWGNGLTVLLEKTFGNIFIDKMRAICLLEADYNWLNKFIFAKKMMDKAYSAGVVPAEQFARRGTQAAEGVLTSTLFCDIIRALHHTGGSRVLIWVTAMMQWPILS